MWTAGNGDPMHEVCDSHSAHSRIETARVKQEEKIEPQNNSKREVRNMEETNVKMNMKIFRMASLALNS